MWCGGWVREDTKKMYKNILKWSQLVVFGRDNSQNTCMLGEVRMDMDGLE